MIKKWFGKAGGVFATLLMIAEIFVIVFIVLSKISGSVPTIFGYQLYVIATPSMEPDIKVGDVIVSKEYGGEALETGCVVTYLGKTGEFAGKMITHEVIRINGDEIITKGKANSSEDPAISREDIRSVMQHKTVILSAVYKVITSTAGFICFIILPFVALIVSEVVGMITEIKKEGKNENQGLDE